MWAAKGLPASDRIHPGMTDAGSRALTSPTDRRLAATASPRHLLRTSRLPRERAHETGVSERTLQRKVARFAAAGMRSLFEPDDPPAADQRSLPLGIRKAIVELKAEYPPLSLRQIAAICRERFARSVSHHAGRSSDGGPHDI